MGIKYKIYILNNVCVDTEINILKIIFVPLET